jgi:hypothetical protein
VPARLLRDPTLVIARDLAGREHPWSSHHAFRIMGERTRRVRLDDLDLHLRTPGTLWESADASACSGEVGTGSPTRTCANAIRWEHGPVPKETGHAATGAPASATAVDRAYRGLEKARRSPT